MGWHTCRFPRWHRALILFGTLGYLYGVGLAVFLSRTLPNTWLAPAMAGVLVSTWLVKHVFQWRCQNAPRRADFQTPAVVLAASLALLAQAEKE